MDTGLLNIYRLIKKVGLIKEIPNISEVKNNMYKMTAIQNIVYFILTSNKSVYQQKQMLKEMGYFNNQQVNWILKNKQIIIAPFNKVYKNQKYNQRKSSTYLLTGGDELPQYSDEESNKSIEEQLDPKGRTLLEKLRDRNAFSRETIITDLFGIDFISLPTFSKKEGESWLITFARYMGLNVNNLIEKYQLPSDYDGFIKRLEELDDTGVLSALAQKDFITFFERIRKVDHKILKQKMDILASDMGIDRSNFLKLNKIFSSFGLNMEGDVLFDTSHITPVDWIFFPLWSVENLPIVGPFTGGPIDFVSLMVAQLDFMTEHFVDVIDNARDPAIQAAMSVFSASTAGAGLAVTPFIVPFVNKTFDIVMHILKNMGKIFNFFINMSRKNFGLSYMLFSEIIPVIEETNEIIFNYLVILNKAVARNKKYAEMYIDFIDNYGTIFLSITNPTKIGEYKDKIVENMKKRAQDKVNEVKSKAEGKVNEVKSKAEGKVNEVKSKAEGKVNEVKSKAEGKVNEVNKKIEKKQW